MILRSLRLEPIKWRVQRPAFDRNGSMTKPGRLRRLTRFTLRGMLLAVTVFCIWLAWLSNAARRQKDSVMRLRSLGGEVSHAYASCLAPIWNDVADDPHGCACVNLLISFVGIDLVTHVIDVKFGPNARLNRDAFSVLQSFPHLECIRIEGAAADGSDLSSFGELRSLRRLELANMLLTDDIAQRLSQWAGLDELCMVGAITTDASLPALSKLHNAKQLDLSRSQVSWAAIWRLEQLLPSCDITPSTASHENDVVVVMLRAEDVNVQRESCAEHSVEAEPRCRIGAYAVAIDVDGKITLEAHKKVMWNNQGYAMTLSGTVHITEVGIGQQGSPIVDSARLTNLRTTYCEFGVGGRIKQRGRCLNELVGAPPATSQETPSRSPRPVRRIGHRGPLTIAGRYYRSSRSLLPASPRLRPY
jgi:hypothetical protein